jgi:phospholipid transport system substrate-binding protein
MKSLWIAIIFILVACQAVNAAGKDPNDPNYPNDPNELIRTKWNAVISVLHNEDLDEEAQVKKINKIVSPIFDFELMAKLALGQRHWAELTVRQQEEFTKLFIERLKTSYREKIALYTNENIQFKPPIKRKTTIYIPMELTSKDKKIAVLHKLRKVGKRWKIYDVEIQGVSVVLTYRSQFDDILSKGTVEDLLSQLAKPPAN